MFINLLLITLISASGIVKLDRDSFPNRKIPYIEKYLEKQRIIKKKMRAFKALYSYTNYPPVERLKTLKDGKQQIVYRILALRVNFTKEDPDDPRTTGDGTMVTHDNGESPILGFDCNGEPYYNPYYDPPHDWQYFNNMMQALASYYYVATYGKVRIEWVVKPDSGLPPYELPHRMCYYGDPNNMELGLVTLLRDAFRAADEDSTIDFDDLDNNGVKDHLEGVYDRYIIFHAGSAWQTDFGDTPCDLAAVTVPAGALKYYLGNSFLILNEGRDTVFDACILPETMSQDGMEIKLQGTLFHESGHNLFMLPDLYDTEYNGAGVGAWGIMTTGPYLEAEGIPSGLIPPLPNAWERLWIDWFLKYQFGEGFIDSRILKEVKAFNEITDIEIHPLQVPVDSFVLHKNGNLYYISANFLEDPYSKIRMIKIPVNHHEYFLLQNELINSPLNDTVICGDTVQVTGKWKEGVVVDFKGENDYLLPGSGLLIWHIDNEIYWKNYAYNEVNAVRPMAVDLEEADHVQDFEKWTDIYPYSYTWFGSPYDPFFHGNNNVFSVFTSPASTDNSGAQTGISIYDISKPGETITLKITRQESFGQFPVAIGRKTVDSTLNYKIYHMPVKGYVETDISGHSIITLQEIEIDSVDLLTLDTVQLDTIVLISVLDSSAQILYSDTLRDREINSPPACGDVDGDGIDEMVFATSMREIHVYKLQDADSDSLLDRVGTYTLPEEIYSTPVILNFPDSTFIGIGAEDGYYYLLRLDGSHKFKFYTGAPARNLAASFGSLLYYQSLDGRIFEVTEDAEVYTFGEEYVVPNEFSLSLADINNSGEPEIITSSSRGKLLIYNASGSKIRERDIEGIPRGNVAIGDIDGDGFLDLVFKAENKLYAFTREAGLISGYPLTITSDTSKFISTPIIADIDNDGKGEILLAVDSSGIESFDDQGEQEEKYPFAVSTRINSYPVIRDLNGDGKFELLYLTSHGDLYAWEIQGSKVFWNGYGNGPEHNAVYKAIPLTETFVSGVSLLYLYPNPVKSTKATLRFKTGDAGTVRIKIYNFAGHKLKEFNFSFNGKVVEEKEINLDGFGPDVYTMVCDFNIGNQKIKKIIRFAVMR